MADIFISYARKDRADVDRLAAQLESAGLTCWWNKQHSAGDKWMSRTEAELDAAKAVLVVWTKHSVGSTWVADEASVGRESGLSCRFLLTGRRPLWASANSRSWTLPPG